ncbi:MULTISPECIES: transposase [unclassified Bradyrhizobium]|uniref:IS110 family transposase n=1 Tax=unclassified Bradyrhizobium TaxID=2631580 RepID=UPI003398A273
MVEATGNSMAVSRVLAPFVARVIIANPLQMKAIAQAHVKTDKIDAGTLASLQAAGYLPQIWTPDAETERKRRLAAPRYQVVRHRTRLKNEVHSILHAHLIPKCPHADLFNGRAGAVRKVGARAGRSSRPSRHASVCPFHASLALGRRRGYDAGYLREEPGAGKPPARICEGEAKWLSYSTTTISKHQFLQS